MKATLPADHQRAQPRMYQHFDADQHHRQAVAPLLEGAIGVDVHGHADHVHPAEDRGAEAEEDEQEGDVHAGRQLAAAHGQLPELGAGLAFMRVV